MQKNTIILILPYTQILIVFLLGTHPNWSRSVAEPEDAPVKVRFEFGPKLFDSMIALSADGEDLFCREINSPPGEKSAAFVERWNLKTGRLSPLVFRLKDKYLSQITPSHQGQFFAAVHGDGVSVWDVRKGVEAARLTCPQSEEERAGTSVRGVAFEEDDQILVVLLFSGKRRRGFIERYRFADRQLISRFDFKFGGIPLMISPRGTYAWTFGPAGMPVLALTSGRILFNLKGPIAFAEDESDLIEVTNERFVRRALPDGKEIGTYKHGLPTKVEVFSWNKRRELLAFPGPEIHQIQVIKTTTGKRLGILDKGTSEASEASIRFSPSGREIAVQTSSTSHGDKYAVPKLSVWRLPDTW